MTVAAFRHPTFNAISVLSGTDHNDTVVVHEGQLRNHLPDHVQRERFVTVSGMPITFYFAPAEKEEMMILGASGFKNDEILDFSQIKEMNEDGISVMWIALPNPGRNARFLNHYIHVAADIETAMC